MGRRRRRSERRQPATCSDCSTRIRWMRFRGSWRMFDPRALDGKQHAGVAYPAENNARAASLFDDLVEDLQGRLGCSRGEAEAHVYAMSWYALHACPPDTTTTSKEDPR